MLTPCPRTGPWLLAGLVLWGCPAPESGGVASPDLGRRCEGPCLDLGPVGDRGAAETRVPDGTVLLRVLGANVGNLDEVEKGTCPAYHKGTQCELTVERLIAAALARYRPDIVVLNEVFDADLCDGQAEKNPAFICHDHKQRDPYHQVGRLLGSGYTVLCDGIAHYDCIGVRHARLKVSGCAAGQVCMGQAQTPAHPAECQGKGGITSVSAVQVLLGNLALTVVNGHPLNAVNNESDKCRLAQYRQVLEGMPTGARNLIMGDMNGDPLRLPTTFPSFTYWNSRVGPGKRFRYHSGPAEASPPPPTWMGLFTLDYVVSDFARGTCRTLGDQADADRLDDPACRMDHRGLLCDLTVPGPGT